MLPIRFIFLVLFSSRLYQFYQFVNIYFQYTNVYKTKYIEYNR